MIVYANGDVKISDGNLIIGAVGHGISFINAADTATGETVSSSVLDDYEEGTWTPIIHTGIPSASYSVQLGHYTRIGNKVHVDFYIQLSASGNASNGVSYELGGMPFTLKAANHVRGGGCTTYFDLPCGTGGSNTAVSAFYGRASTNRMFMYQGKTSVQGANNDNCNSKYLIGFVEYITD